MIEVESVSFKLAKKAIDVALDDLCEDSEFVEVESNIGDKVSVTIVGFSDLGIFNNDSDERTFKD